MAKKAWILWLACGLVGCADGTAPEQRPATDAAPRRLAWAIAIHGGAGTIPRDMAGGEREGYLASLRQALELGRSLLDEGRSSLDTVERVVRAMEDDPRFNAGKGAIFNHDGDHELDASIMDGRTLRCGAVAAVRTARNPIRAARAVMEHTGHVLLVGAGADAFVAARGLEQVEPSYFFTERRHRQLLERQGKPAEPGGGTVGVVALDREGNLAAGTSTGGMTDKLAGRVGDSPVIGAGTYADNRSCAVSGTGTGEEFIRHAVAFHVSSRMLHAGDSLQQAARRVVHDVLAAGDGGIVAVDRAGNIAMEFNSSGMYRGAADADGRFEVYIWD